MTNITYHKDGITVDGEFISTIEIRSKCLEVYIKEDNLRLMTIKWPSHRGFDGLEEKYVDTAEKISKLKGLLTGRDIYFGEIAGKHSEVYGTIEEGEITITENLNEIRDFLLVKPSGHEYDHSFIFKFQDHVSDGTYEDLTEEDIAFI